MPTPAEIEAAAKAICAAEGFKWDDQLSAMTSASGGDNEQEHYWLIAKTALVAAEATRNLKD